MWLEVQALFTLISVFFTALVMVLLLRINTLFVFLLFMAIVFAILGDLAISIKVWKNHLKWLIDQLPPNDELVVLFDFDGGFDFVRTRKGPFGKREFVRYKKHASIINQGDFPIHSICGNRGFLGHVDYDMNVNLYEAEALSKLKGKDVKEIYDNAPKDLSKVKELTVTEVSEKDVKEDVRKIARDDVRKNIGGTAIQSRLKGSLFRRKKHD